MQPYFIWNGVDSRTMGIITTSYPPIIRPPERVIQQVIPGRPGSVTLTEGDDIYDAYIKSFVIGTRPTADTQAIIRWLRGEGQAIFGNEPDFVYTGRIVSAVQFDKVGQWITKSAAVQLYTQPFKAKTESDVWNINGSATISINNPGDVPSRPLMRLQCQSPVKITIGNTEMNFLTAPGIINIDCDACTITNEDGTLWTGLFSGEFIRMGLGSNQVSISQASAQLRLQARWRWL